MNPLPPAYGWIDDLRPLPRMLQEARKLFGTKEVAGSANNPVILGWAKMQRRNPVGSERGPL
jgi:hypothetical protein